MKHNYNFRVDEPDPEDKVIRQHQNFDGLLSDYHNLTTPLYRRPLYKNPRAFIGLVLILVIGFLVFQAVEEEDEINRVAELPVEVREAEERAFLAPLFGEESLAKAKFEIEPGMARIIELESGTRIHLPADAFPESAGIVDLRIQEFSDPLAAILAGIPLQAVDDGQLLPHWIVHLSAFANGKPISYNPNAKILIETEGPRNREEELDVLYTLDLEEMNWKPIDKEVEIQEVRTSPPVQSHLDDGFGVVEYLDEGGIRRDQLDSIQAPDPSEVSIKWVRSFESAPNGWVLCGQLAKLDKPEVNVQLQTDTGKTPALYALYQIEPHSNAIRSYWPHDAEFTYRVAASASPDSKIFGFAKDGKLVWAKAPNEQKGEELQVIPAQVSTQRVQGLDELKRMLGLTAN